MGQVHRGLKGLAYTVFEGTEPSALEVEILGVLHNALGPHQDMILARLGGKETIYTGVVAGMSGSPVYIDGKLVGAVAFRIGQFSKEPIAGITPIEQMLQVRAMPVAATDLVADTAPAAGSIAAAAVSGEVRPIETPLVFSGFAPETVQQFGGKFSALGLTAESGIGGGSSDAKQPEPIVPGSAVSALLVRGDMEIAATCTATYVDPQQLLACGHPITQFGSISVPMNKAEVVATLPSPLNAFKIVNTTEEVGAFTQDRQTAIRGEFGRRAQMIPVTMRVRRGDLPAAKEQTIHFDVADNPELTPLLLMVSVYQGLMENNSYGAETTYSLRGRIATASGPEVKLDALMAPTDGMPSAMSTALLIGQRFSKLYANRSRETRMRSIELEVEAAPGRHSLQIESATAGRAQVHAGDTIELQADLRPFHGPIRRVSIPVKVPATLEPGPLRLVVSDAASIDKMTTAPSGQSPELDVQQTADELNAAKSNDRLYVTLLMPAAQAELDGQTLAAVPLSMVNVLEPRRTNRALLLNGESAVPVISVPMHAMVSGEQVVTLQVE
ncbi:MAG: SpoIVB peptidase S55 domain-containing protein [Acidobacteriaceae bacterium]